jgi:hypothetical protein
VTGGCGVTARPTGPARGRFSSSDNRPKNRNSAIWLFLGSNSDKRVSAASNPG